MFCPTCGNNCPDNAISCPNCGHSFGNAQQPPVNPYMYNNAPAAPKNSKTVLVLGIVALVICATMGCLCGCLGALPGIVCAIISIVLGSGAKKELAFGQEDKNIKTGMLLSYIALGVAVLFIVLNAILGGVLTAGSYY